MAPNCMVARILFCSAFALGSGAIGAQTLFGIGRSDTIASVLVRRPAAATEQVPDGVPDGEYAISIKDRDIPGTLYVRFNEVSKGWFSRDDYQSKVVYLRWMPSERLDVKAAAQVLRISLTAPSCLPRDNYGFKVCKFSENYFAIFRKDGSINSVDLDFHEYRN